MMKILLFTGGFLGFIQAVAWTAMSILCILCYFKEITGDKEAHNFGVDRIINADNFFIFVWFYLVLSAIWCLASGCVLWALMRSKRLSSIFLSPIWSGLAILISIVDVVLTGLIGHDYSVMNDEKSRIVDVDKDKILLSQGIVLIVAARGIILWIINVVSAILIFLYLDSILNQKETETFPIINGYESASSHPPWKSSFPTQDELWPQQNANFNFYGNRNNAADVNDFYVNSDVNNKSTHNDNRTNYYRNDNRNQNNFPRTKSFAEAIAENANKVATVGRNRPKPPPNTLYPEIPEPDYSPIEDRKLKSVLRPTSHYM